MSSSIKSLNTSDQELLDLISLVLTESKEINNNHIHCSHQQPIHQQPIHQQPIHQQPIHQQPIHQQPIRCSNPRQTLTYYNNHSVIIKKKKTNIPRVIDLTQNHVDSNGVLDNKNNNCISNESYNAYQTFIDNKSYVEFYLGTEHLNYLLNTAFGSPPLSVNDINKFNKVVELSKLIEETEYHKFAVIFTYTFTANLLQSHFKRKKCKYNSAYMPCSKGMYCCYAHIA